MPGATVELANVATGIAQTQVTGAGGNYVFNAVKPGSYRITASLKGFKTVQPDRGRRAEQDRHG